MTGQVYAFAIFAGLGIMTLLSLLVGDVRRRQLQARHHWQRDRLSAARDLMKEIEAGLGPIEALTVSTPSVTVGDAHDRLRGALAQVPDELRAEMKLLAGLTQRAEADPDTFSRAIRTLLASPQPPSPVLAPQE
ncbi:MAG: hypothetical protein AB7O52_09535 [Planctomycetota bacterium]